jgi:GYF domain 2/PilZ domain
MVADKNAEWVLQSSGAEYGPYSMAELRLVLQSGKLTGEKFIWKRGLTNWLRINDGDDLASKVAAAIEKSQELVIERGNNIRGHIRSTLIATVAISTRSGKFFGICFDLSKGGLAVTELKAPDLEKNQVYDILIIPLTTTGVQPFSSKGRLARLDADKRGAGFQFMSAVDKISVVNYLRARQKGYD